MSDSNLTGGTGGCFNVSVVMPAYNVEQWITTALASVAGQTLRPHEVIVVDDGSTDDTVRRVQSGGVGVRLIHTDRANAAGARNAGVEAATGDWVAFLDADDWWLPEHLSRAARHLTRSGDAAYMCHFRALPHGADRPEDQPRHLDEPRAGLSQDVFLDWLARKPYFNHQGVVVRRDVINAAGRYDPSQVRRHDFEMFMRVINGRTWSYNPEVGTIYRANRPGNLSGNDVERTYFFLRALVKNEQSYRGPVMSRLLRSHARKALGAALRHGTAAQYTRAWAIAKPWLSPHEVVTYGLAAMHPPLAKSLFKYKRQFPRVVAPG